MVAGPFGVGIDFSGRGLLAAAAAIAMAFAVLPAAPALAQGQAPQQQQPPQAAEGEEEGEVEEIALTAKLIDSFIAAQKEITPITAGLKQDTQPTQQMMTQMENIAKKHGFKDFDEFADVGANIGLVFAGIDPQSKKYDPQGLVQREIAAVNADSKLTAAQKRQIVQDLQQAAASTPKLKYPGNADLVIQAYDRLKPVMDQ